jgi:hypothetical protein
MTMRQTALTLFLCLFSLTAGAAAAPDVAIVMQIMRMMVMATMISMRVNASLPGLCGNPI